MTVYLNMPDFLLPVFQPTTARKPPLRPLTLSLCLVPLPQVNLEAGEQVTAATWNSASAEGTTSSLTHTLTYDLTPLRRVSFSFTFHGLCDMEPSPYSVLYTTSFTWPSPLI